MSTGNQENAQEDVLNLLGLFGGQCDVVDTPQNLILLSLFNILDKD